MNFLEGLLLYKLYVRHVVQNDIINWSKKMGRSVAIAISDNIPKDVIRVYVYGAKSEDEIESHSKGIPENVIVHYFVRIDKNNLYAFTSRMLEKAAVTFIPYLGEKKVDEKLHQLGLLHCASRQKKSILWRLLDRVHIRCNSPAVYMRLSYLLSVELLNFILERVKFKCADYTFSLYPKEYNRPKLNRPLRSSRRILITGWYGTETVGDKAILMEIVNQFRLWNTDVSVSLTSIIPSLSRLSNEELGLNCNIIPLDSVNRRLLAKFDCIVFGGGPIMDSTQLRFISSIFIKARKMGKHTLIFGCGVGPLKSKKGLKNAKKILSHATGGFFRDEESALFAINLGWKYLPHVGCDPALNYVRNFKGESYTLNSNKVICLFREQTLEYSVQGTRDNDHLKQTLVRFTAHLQGSENQVTLLPMHSFWYGKDDRFFNEEIKKINENISFQKRPYLLDEIISECRTSGLNVVTRFHGHIFSLALGVPFISLDYTGTNGKIDSLLKRYDLQDTSIRISEVDYTLLREKLEFINENKIKILQKIELGVQRDLENLNRCYNILSQL